MITTGGRGELCGVYNGPRWMNTAVLNCTRIRRRMSMNVIRVDPARIWDWALTAYVRKLVHSLYQIILHL